MKLQAAASTAFAAELAWGIHPWIDVGAGIAARSVQVGYFVQREIQDEVPPQLIGQGDTFRYTTEFRLRSTFAPMATYPVRPTASVALAYWQGTKLDKVLQLSDFPVEVFGVPHWLLLHVGPGVEFSPSPFVSLYARVNVELKVAGKRTWRSSTGDTSVMMEPPDTEKIGGGGGWNLALGATLRVGPLVKPKSAR
jgi:hypothetical protein